MIDRYIASVALQLWQRFFQLALSAGVVSNSEEMWKTHRISALEYLARGKMMAIFSLFYDGPVLREEGDIDLYQAAQRGIAIALGAGDPATEEAARTQLLELVGDIDAAERELEKLLADRCAYISAQGPEAVALELARCPELLPQHRAWLGSPIAAARGAVVAAEVEREAMPPTSSAPGQGEENQGFHPAFFQAPAERGPGKSSTQRAAELAARAKRLPGAPSEPPAAAGELEQLEQGGADAGGAGEQLEPPAAAPSGPSAFNPNMTLFRPGKPA